MNRTVPIYDAHCHLQDSRLAADLDPILAAVESLPIRKAVVNGTRPEDWQAVADLSHQRRWIIPFYGLHPWHVNQASDNWRDLLENFLRAAPAGVGEIGLDKWIQGCDFAKQEEAFLWQLRLAAELRRPVAIHCLKAWGPMLDILQQVKPAAGFLLHSYGGPAEMIRSFAELGGYFSISGYFAQARKSKQRDVFRTVPLDRILVETDAPDMAGPNELQPYKLFGREGEMLNHPANLGANYKFAATLYNIPEEEFALNVENNFQRLFAPLLAAEVRHL